MKVFALFNGLFLYLTAICLLVPDGVQAQSLAGTNAPGAATNFSIVVPAGATNFSLVVSNNSTAYSHLLLKKGGTPTDTDYDFISRLNGRTNQINLELPQFASGSYGCGCVRPAHRSPRHSECFSAPTAPISAPML